MAADEGGRPTLETVAARAGVSRATVSRVVNGSTTVAPEIRARVGAALRELGYVPHGAARTLAGRRSDTVAIVVCEPDSRVFDDPWLGEFVRGARAELTASGLHPVLLLAPDPAEQERCAAYLAGARVTGALVLSSHDGHPLPGLLRRAGVPTVLSGRPAEADAGLAYVDVDNRAAAERAVRWLRERGRRTVAAVAGPQDMAAARERLAGYRAAMGAELRPSLVEIADFTRTGGRRATARLLAREPGIDAVFAASDQMALGALQAVRDAGRGAPEVAVVGFDDVRHVAGDAEPALTTVHQPSAEMGRALARLLLAGRGGADALVFPTRLVVRGSA